MVLIYDLYQYPLAIQIMLGSAVIAPRLNIFSNHLASCHVSNICSIHGIIFAPNVVACSMKAGQACFVASYGNALPGCEFIFSNR